MSSNAEKAILIATLIQKHKGWVDDVDKEMVRFPTPDAMHQFLKELHAAEID